MNYGDAARLTLAQFARNAPKCRWRRTSDSSPSTQPSQRTARHERNSDFKPAGRVVKPLLGNTQGFSSMADSFQVTCHKPDNQDADRRLQGLGGPGGGGWYHDIDTLISGIESNAFKLWTVAPTGQSVWVIVAKRANGRKYLKTEPDGVEPNNLLKLPHCA